MKQLFLCHLHSCVISLLSQTTSASFCICFICFGGPIRCLKIAGVSFRIEGRTLAVFNGSFPLIWILLWRTLPVRPEKRQSRLPALFRQREGRWRRCSGALLLFHTVFLGTNEYLFWNIFLFFRFFSSLFSTEKDRRTSFFCLSLVRCR